MRYLFPPKLDEPTQLLDTLVHELCHAVDDCFSGHGEDFKGIAQTVGLGGPARMAHATEELIVKLMMISQELGPYPHKAIEFPPPRPSNASRSKAKCGQCGYEVMLLKKWASYAPICPKDNICMIEAVTESIENTSDYYTESVENGIKKSADEIRRAIS